MLLKACSVSKHKRLDITCDQNLTNQITKSDRFSASYDLLATSVSVKCNCWLDSGLLCESWAKKILPTWASEDNQHNSVQRLSRDMGCVSRWVHVIQLTNWSSSRLSVCPAHPPLRSWINKHCRWILVVVILAVADWESCKTLEVKVIAEVAWEWARRLRCQAMEGVHRRQQSRAARRPSSWGRSSPSCCSSSASGSAPPSRYCTLSLSDIWVTRQIANGQYKDYLDG